MKKSLLFTLSIVIICSGLTACESQKDTGADDSPEKQVEQWSTLAEAYRYVYPLVLMYATMKSATNTVEADGAGHAPVNQLIHSQKLATSNSKMVVSPNVDTVYTQAWVDLEEQPMVFVKPETDRFYQVQVLDAWTNTPAVLKDAGAYLLTTSDWTGTVPANVTRIDVPTNMVWLIGRVIVNNQADLENISSIQSQMKLLPLDAYSTGAEYIPPAGKYNEQYDVVPSDSVVQMDPEAFFTLANQLMVNNPPAPADEKILARIKTLGVGPGLDFKVSALLGDVETQWKEMLKDLRKTLLTTAQKYTVKLGDWSYFGDPIGNFGTAYDFRALIALGGLGANTTQTAIYPKTQVDSKGDQLLGANTYQLHFDALPSVLESGFWSVTAYGSDDFLISNEIDRYCINDRSDFHLNQDGSLDIILSAEKPDNEANWLPVSADDEFHLFMRIYLPDMEVINNNWQAPVITKMEQ